MSTDFNENVGQRDYWTCLLRMHRSDLCLQSMMALSLLKHRPRLVACSCKASTANKTRVAINVGVTCESYAYSRNAESELPTQCTAERDMCY